MAELRVTLLGDDASLGVIPAADVARLLSGVEKAIARAAEVRQGRTGRWAGRRDAEREAATRLMLRSLEPGSLTAVLDVPGGDAAGETLEMADPSLGELAAADILRTLNEGEEHPRVAEALSELADNLDIGRRRQKLEMELTDDNGRTRSHIDAAVAERLRGRAEQPTVEEESTIAGTMFAVNQLTEQSPTIEQLATAQGIDLNANYNRVIEVEDDDPEIDAFFEALGLQ